MSAALPSEACVYGVLGTLTTGATAHVLDGGGYIAEYIAGLLRNRRVPPCTSADYLSCFADADVIQQDDFHR